jgi:hypothetical protein
MSALERPPSEVFCLACGPEAWLREHIDPTWDTSALTPEEAAKRIAAWVRLRLP